MTPREEFISHLEHLIFTIEYQAQYKVIYERQRIAFSNEEKAELEKWRLGIYKKIKEKKDDFINKWAPKDDT